jgi:protein-tyrosine-phosphatase/DNA-binding transcriptional ArsR family regulator
MANVERRAMLHAALGEPVRLTVVDALARQDASPGELAAFVGLSSNLLAHHLKVLDDAGVIRRVRSEGDRRRNYVQLRLDDPMVWAAAQAGLDPVPPSDAPRVVFVCTANSARSQLAAARWNAISPVPATSAGTHPASRVHPRAAAVGRRHGLHLPARPTAVDQVVRDDDLVVAVCDNVHEELDASQVRLHWSIPDPVRIDTDDAFEAAYADIARRVERLAAAVSVDPTAQPDHPAGHPATPDVSLTADS